MILSIFLIKLNSDYHFPFIENYMLKIYGLLIIGIIFAILAKQIQANRTLQSSNYVINPDRTTQSQRYCQGFDRSQIIDINKKQTNENMHITLSEFFKFSSVNIARNALIGQKGKAYDEIKPSISPLMIFIGPFVLGLIILLLMIPLLICCTFCTGCCPPRKFITDQKYSKCSLVCPMVGLTIFLLLAIGSSIVGIIYSTQIQHTYQQTKCSIAVMFDNVLNGNYMPSRDQYFIGLVTADQELAKLNTNIIQLNSAYQQIIPSTAVITQAITDIDAYNSQLSNIPNGSGGSLSLTYSTPLNSDAPTSSITSSFPNKLGKNTQQKTLIGTNSQKLTNAKKSINKISTNADTFTSLTQKFISQKPGIDQQMKSVINMFKNGNSETEKYYNQYSSLYEAITIGLYILFGFIILLSCLIILSSCLINCCQFAKIIHLLRTFCCFLIIATIILFCITILLSFLTPTSIIFCDYSNDSLNSQSRFRANLEGVFQNQQALGRILACIPDSDGDLIGQSIGIDAINLISSLTTSNDEIKSFNDAKYSQVLQNQYLKLGSSINSVINSHQLDINDQTSIQILQRIATPTQYSCISAGFNEDSWIPSAKQQNIKCKVNAGASNINTCPNNNDFITRAVGCVGCMETTSLFSNNATKTDVKGNLDNRYSDTSCNLFTTELSNTWNNYYKVKQDAISPVYRRYNNSINSKNTLINNIDNTITPLFNQIYTKTNQLVPNVVSSKGLAGGLNCRLFGYDMVTLSQNICISWIPSLFHSYLITGLTSYFLLSAICFISIFGIRHYKQLNTQQGYECKNIKSENCIESGSQIHPKNDVISDVL